ncbi:YciI family protein [Mycolicibacterium chlorophenolicum]|uniref:YciI-like protein n=1 Tax=Mycolicibacterium chlorophenolicum TaxID=37916 RepID=A0A0J6V7Y0_9MYCO|nr:YciI family protein [Mycolicibacterium chlorophenolicum]KMO66955.1 YciI-like protein [Mycolicibacterium chlorophenolicum]
MAQDGMTWAETLQYSAEQKLLAKQLYLVFSRPVNSFDRVMEVVDEHLDYQRELESRGIMFAAGPLATTDEQHWNGEGLFVYRAESLAAAKAIADADPMHRKNARQYEIRTWLLNEGNLGIDVLLSHSAIHIK